MNDLSLFPVITEKIINDCGIQIGKYIFEYEVNGERLPLKQSGKTTIKLSDPIDIDRWRLEEDGLCFSKKIVISYPSFLYGPSGIVCKNAEIGLCINWTNDTLTQTGCILPYETSSSSAGTTYSFSHKFKPGDIKGDLKLSVNFYVKQKADCILPGEECLMNIEGIDLGEIENTVIDFSSVYMDFPIEECYSQTDPLWWIEFSSWEDPASDLFSKENVCLYLNKYYDSCPMSGETIRNKDLLIDILASAYFLIFKKIEDEGRLPDTKNNVGLYPNSICSIMHQFILSCDNLQWETSESLLKSLQVNIYRLLNEDGVQ